MAIRYVLFDLDGTLLPMDQEQFVQAYVKGLATKMAPYGFDPKAIGEALWMGTGAMMKTDGSLRNDELFWKVFQGIVGKFNEEHMGAVEDFYHNEFQNVRTVCGFNPRAADVVALVKERGLIPVLATNPLFPRPATESRIRWAGLQPEDFAYVTVYDNSYFCKPNVKYYEEILRTIGASPEECVMIGNDAKEDTVVDQLGIPVFLLTDCLINSDGRDISKFPHGGFGELMTYIRSL